MLQIFITRRNLGTWLSNHGDRQVIAPFLIILRVSNRSALTSDTIISGNVGSMQFEGEGESTSGNGTLPDEYSTEGDGGTPVAEVPS